MTQNIQTMLQSIKDKSEQQIGKIPSELQTSLYEASSILAGFSKQENHQEPAPLSGVLNAYMG